MTYSPDDLPPGYRILHEAFNRHVAAQIPDLFANFGPPPVDQSGSVESPRQPQADPNQQPLPNGPLYPTLPGAQGQQGQPDPFLEQVQRRNGMFNKRIRQIGPHAPLAPPPPNAMNGLPSAGEIMRYLNSLEQGGTA